MATRRPDNGRRVFVALHEVHPALRHRVAAWLAHQRGASLPMTYAQQRALHGLRTTSMVEQLELGMAAAAPRVRADGSPYGVWCSAAEAARARAGVWPVLVPRGRPRAGRARR